MKTKKIRSSGPLRTLLEPDGASTFVVVAVSLGAGLDVTSEGHNGLQIDLPYSLPNTRFPPDF